MNRRAFLSTLAAGMAAAIDPERLVWEPGRKLISIPKPIPIGPLRYWSDPPYVIVGVDQQVVSVLNDLLRHKWHTDPAFRQQLNFETARAFVEETQRTVIGRGHFKELFEYVPPGISRTR